MDLKRELRRREWPVRPQDTAYSASTYVSEGRLFTRALQLRQDLSEPIPPGECAITSLVATPRGTVYGATSGARAHLFRYSGSSGDDGVYDLGVIEGARAVRRSLVAGPHGTVLGGISESADGKREGGLFTIRGWRRPRAGHGGHGRRRRPSEHPPRPPGVEVLPAPVSGECVAAMAADRARGVAYGLSSKSATLFSVDMTTDEVRIKGRATTDVNYSHILVADRRGNIYGAGPLGRLFRYNAETDEIEQLALSLPTVAGREFYNRMDSAALDPATGLIYGGGSADGVIFVFDPEQMTIRSLGKVVAEPRCRAITVGLDGRVYGVVGEAGGMGHLFCYDPLAQELRDLGIPFATSERSWHGYEFDAACTGPNGEIYLGESDRISHLFIYFPPIRPQGQDGGRE